jgi:hypothetical protein
MFNRIVYAGHASSIGNGIDNCTPMLLSSDLKQEYLGYLPQYSFSALQTDQSSYHKYKNLGIQFVWQSFTDQHGHYFNRLLFVDRYNKKYCAGNARGGLYYFEMGEVIPFTAFDKNFGTVLNNVGPEQLTLNMNSGRFTDQKYTLIFNLLINQFHEWMQHQFAQYQHWHAIAQYNYNYRYYQENVPMLPSSFPNRSTVVTQNAMAHEMQSIQQAQLEQERIEKERLENERLEQERLEQERLQKQHLEVIEQQRLQQQQIEQELQEVQRAALEAAKTLETEVSLNEEWEVQRSKRKQKKPIKGFKELQSNSESNAPKSAHISFDAIYEIDSENEKDDKAEELTISPTSTSLDTSPAASPVTILPEKKKKNRKKTTKPLIKTSSAVIDNSSNVENNVAPGMLSMFKAKSNTLFASCKSTAVKISNTEISDGTATNVGNVCIVYLLARLNDIKLRQYIEQPNLLMKGDFLIYFVECMLASLFFSSAISMYRDEMQEIERASDSDSDIEDEVLAAPLKKAKKNLL